MGGKRMQLPTGGHFLTETGHKMNTTAGFPVKVESNHYNAAPKKAHIRPGGLRLSKL